jgi:predicted permease
LLLGREFTRRDSKTATKVAVINQTMARHYFGDASPIGRMVYFPKSDAQGRYIPFGRQLDKDQAVEVVGVVQDAKYDDLRDPTPPMAYLPMSQADWFPQSIEIRTARNPKLVAPLIRPMLKEINSNLILRNVTTLKEQIDDTLTQERLLTKLLGFFGLLAFGLVCIGIYGLLSYAVVRRTGEIGIRMALGARRGDVLRMVLRESLLLVAIGLSFGIPAALAAVRLASSLISGLLFGLKASDPLTIMMAALLMAAVALVAGYLPARRASRVDPMVALRYE